ncbi:hypothetical protein, partial [Paraburkholderia sp. Ac-20347]|uniref:hypothetical protein n=1 Tax=Paraburkholderia sp. Ac-20347 TaxID=2703892 RepID=UPI00197D13B3
MPPPSVESATPTTASKSGGARVRGIDDGALSGAHEVLHDDAREAPLDALMRVIARHFNVASACVLPGHARDGAHAGAWLGEGV